MMRRVRKKEKTLDPRLLMSRMTSVGEKREDSSGPRAASDAAPYKDKEKDGAASGPKYNKEKDTGSS